MVITAYRRRVEPIPGTTLALVNLLSASQIDNTQVGANVVWSYRITPLYTLTTNANWYRTVANDQSDLRSRQWIMQSTLAAPLSKLTRVFGGVRYQRFTSSHEARIEETSLFVGLDHAFR